MFKYELIGSSLIAIVTVFDILNYLLINDRTITCFSSFIYSKLKTIEHIQFFVYLSVENIIIYHKIIIILITLELLSVFEEHI